MKRMAMIVGLLLAGSSAALASSVGPIQYEAPWPSYPGKAAGSVFADEGSSAQLIVEGPYELTVEAAAAQGGKSGGKVVTETELTVAGLPGYLVVRKKGKEKIASAATVVDGAAYVFTVVAKADDYDAAVEAWGTMVDNAWVNYGGETSAEPSWEPQYEYEQPADSGGGGDDTRWYTVTLTNVASDCQASLSIDGQSQVLAADEVREIQLAGGRHAMTWQNRDGTSGEDTYDVPDLTAYSFSCKPAKRGQSASREEAESDYQPPAREQAPSSGYSAADLDVGAENYVNLYYTCLNYMSYSGLFGAGSVFTIPSLAGRLSEAAASNDALAAQLMNASAALNSLSGSWEGARDEGARYQLQRASAQFAINFAGHDNLEAIWGSHGCASNDDPAGCWVQASSEKAAEYYAASAKQQKVVEDYMSSSIANNFIFNATMNVMAGYPAY